MRAGGEFRQLGARRIAQLEQMDILGDPLGAGDAPRDHLARYGRRTIGRFSFGRHEG